MRKSIFIVFMSLFITSAWAQSFHLSDVTINPGGEAVSVDVSIDGAQKFTAFQFDIQLPVGLSVATKDGKLRVSPLRDIMPKTVDSETMEVTYSHVVQSSYAEIDKRTLRVICYSTASEELTATSGRVCRIYLQSDPYAKPGAANIKICNVVMTALAGAGTTQVKPADVTVSNVKVSPDATVDINITASNKWGTALVPFSKAVPDGLRMFTCVGFETKKNTSGVDVTYLVISEKHSFIPYMPCLLYSKEGYSGKIEGTINPTYYPATTLLNTTGSMPYLRACLESNNISSGYILQNQGSSDGTMFYTIFGKTFTVPAGKCWLVMPSTFSSEAKSIGFMLEDDATSARQVKAEEATQGEFYTLDGKLVDNPVPGNIYVTDGKKVVIVK